MQSPSSGPDGVMCVRDGVGVRPALRRGWSSSRAGEAAGPSRVGLNRWVLTASAPSGSPPSPFIATGLTAQAHRWALFEGIRTLRRLDVPSRASALAQVGHPALATSQPCAGRCDSACRWAHRSGSPLGSIRRERRRGRRRRRRRRRRRGRRRRWRGGRRWRGRRRRRRWRGRGEETSRRGGGEAGKARRRRLGGD